MNINDYLGRKIKVIVDRPKGSKHPKYDTIYPINYGYIPNTISGDGEEIDAYILGVNEPVTEFEGTCIGIIHRTNDNEDKLVASNKEYSNEEIENDINFIEQYFEHEIIRDNIKLRLLKETDFEKIYHWCQNKYVYEWFEQRKLSLDEIKEKYQNKLNSKKQDLFIINYNNHDIGLVQKYLYKDKTYEYDLFIGEEEYLSKGIGSRIVNLVNEKIFNDYSADSIILRPFKRNERACNCYKKCGFKIVKEYDDVDTLGNKEKIVMFMKERGE